MPKSEWIDAKEKPEDGTKVLMTYNDLVLYGIYIGGKFFYPINYVLEEQEGITHWMPFPEPPQL